jgi:Tfp pilus assembly protein PilF
LALILLFAISFVLFRGTTHFSGDGFQLLSRLAGHSMVVKSWDLGASLAHSGVYVLLGGGGLETAKLAYQLVSICSGLGLLIVAGVFARLLFEDNLRRVVFFLGLATGGYMLMFFGYVENYATLNFAVIAFTLMGLAAIEGRLSPWWSVIPFAVAVSFHVFGFLLIPALLYLLLRDTTAGRKLGRLHPSVGISAGVLALVLMVMAYFALYSRYLFFTFAFLPITPDRFTIDNYTVLSGAHLVDLLNLLILLLPGLPVMLVVLFAAPFRTWFKKPPYRFLLILLFFTGAAVVVFDPRLGMPRDWDLMAVVGAPLAVFSYYLVLNHRRRRFAVTTGVLTITLGIVMLIPRVAVQVEPDLAIAHFKNYLELDKVRGRNARHLLVDYLLSTGDTAGAQTEQARFQADFPEWTYNSRTQELVNQGKYAEAAAWAKRAIAINPMYFDAYYNLAGCYLQMGRTDSALILLEIANGINPYNAAINALIGSVYYGRRDYTRAEGCYLKAFRLDSLEENALAGLAWLNLRQRKLDSALVYVNRLATLDVATWEYFVGYADGYRALKAYPHARQCYDLALRKGLDRPAYDSLLLTLPESSR